MIKNIPVPETAHARIKRVAKAKNITEPSIHHDIKSETEAAINEYADKFDEGLVKNGITDEYIAGMRRCPKCKQAKKLSEFHTESRKKTAAKKHSHCKECRK